jgi:hypothetical protein
LCRSLKRSGYIFSEAAIGPHENLTAVIILLAALLVLIACFRRLKKHDFKKL